MKIHPQFEAGYKVLSELKLIIEYRSGFVDVPGLFEYRVQQANDPLFNLNLDIFKELTEMDIDLVITDLEDYANHVAKIKEVSKVSVKEACLVKTPHQIIHGQMLKKYMDALDLQFNIFTDMQSAIDWLEKPITPDEVTSIVNELKHNPTFIWRG